MVATLGWLIVAVGAACSSGASNGSSGTPPPPQPPPPPPPARAINSYLHEAIDQGEFFRWTPAYGAAEVVVPIQVDEGNLAVTLRAGMRTILAQARDAWKDAIRASTWLETSTRWLPESQPFAASVAFMEVKYVQRLSGRLGSVQIERNGPRSVAKVVMTLALESDVNNRALTQNELLAVAIHEFGHAYGLYKFGPAQGHSSHTGSVMYSGSDWTTLAPGDAATIRELYRLTPTESRMDSRPPSGPPPEITVYYASSYPHGIAVELGTQRYELRRGENYRLRLSGPQDTLRIWECPSTCRWTPFAVVGGTAYSIVDRSGGGLNLVRR